MDLASSESDLHSAALSVAGWESVSPWLVLRPDQTGGFGSETYLLKQAVLASLERELTVIVVRRVWRADIHSLDILFARVSQRPTTLRTGVMSWGSGDETGRTGSSTHSLYEPLAEVLILLNPSFCADPPSGQLSLMNFSALVTSREPTAATTCETSLASRSAVGETRSRTNEPEIAGWIQPGASRLHPTAHEDM